MHYAFDSARAVEASESSDQGKRSSPTRIFPTSGGDGNTGDEKLHFNVWSISDVLRIAICADTRIFGSSQLGHFLDYLEQIWLVLESQGDLTAGEIREKIGVPETSPLPIGLEYVDGCWIDVAEVHRLVADTLSPRDARIFVDKVDSQAMRIVAYVLPGEGSVTIDEIHRSVVARLPGRRFVMAPHWYVICSRSAVRDSIEDWRGIPVEVQGSGRSATQ
jgi:hypothetical protein